MTIAHDPRSVQSTEVQDIYLKSKILYFESCYISRFAIIHLYVVSPIASLYFRILILSYHNINIYLFFCF